MPGVVSLLHGFGHQQAAATLRVAGALPGQNANELTDDHLIDPLSGTAALSAAFRWKSAHPVTAAPHGFFTTSQRGIVAHADLYDFQFLKLRNRTRRRWPGLL